MTTQGNPIHPTHTLGFSGDFAFSSLETKGPILFQFLAVPEVMTVASDMFCFGSHGSRNEKSYDRSNAQMLGYKAWSLGKGEPETMSRQCQKSLNYLSTKTNRS